MPRGQLQEGKLPAAQLLKLAGLVPSTSDARRAIDQGGAYLGPEKTPIAAHDQMIDVVDGLLLWVGLTLILAELRWFARRPMTERLGPYVPGGMGGRARMGLLSVESFREALYGPVVATGLPAPAYRDGEPITAGRLSQARRKHQRLDARSCSRLDRVAAENSSICAVRSCG